MENCTFSGNRAPQGGAISLTHRTAALIHCTIAGNFAGDDGGGGIETTPTSFPPTVELTNTIVAGNFAGSGKRDLKFGAGTVLNFLGTNVVEKPDTELPFQVSAIMTDPKLKPLGDYGGPTQTMPLSKSSPVRAARTSSASTVDQRGIPRPNSSGKDTVGAVQFFVEAPESDRVVVTTSADELDAPGIVGQGMSLREAIQVAKPGWTIAFAKGVDGAGLDPAKGSLYLTKDVTIDGSGLIDRSGHEVPMPVEGNDGTRVFEIPFRTLANPVKVTLKRLDILRGKATGGGGAGVRNLGKLKMIECTVRDCKSEKGGGAIENSNQLEMSRCTLRNNEANLDTNDTQSPGGGAIDNGGRLVLSQCTLSGNKARFGGAIDQFVPPQRPGW